MKKVLLIAYDFPPRGSGGVIRNTKIVKYLPEFGWQPIVLTAQNMNPILEDSTLLSEIPEEAIIYRISTLLPKRFYKSYRSQILNTKLEESVGKSTKGYKKFLKAAYSVIENGLIIPDNKISWIPNAIVNGIKISKKHKIDAIMTSSPPHSTQLIGTHLNTILRLPWLTDFRDEWADNPYFKPKYKFRELIEAKMEKRIVKRCDTLIANTPKSYKRYCQRYPKYTDKFYPITNGYDEDDFSDLQKIKSEKFTIGYIGSLGKTRQPNYFFEALVELFKEYPKLESEIQVNFVGPFYDIHHKMIHEYQLQDSVIHVGNLGHKECLSYMTSVDCLLLLLMSGEATEGIIPGKTYEYLRAGRPILAAVPQGAASELVSTFADSVIVNPTDIIAIKNAIHTFYKRRDAENSTNEKIKKFDRKYLTGELAKQLDKITESE